MLVSFTLIETIEMDHVAIGKKLQGSADLIGTKDLHT